MLARDSSCGLGPGADADITIYSPHENKACVCHGCGRRFQADGRLAGRRLPCPACGHIIAVPDRDSVAPFPGPDLDTLASLESGPTLGHSSGHGSMPPPAAMQTMPLQRAARRRFPVSPQILWGVLACAIIMMVVLVPAGGLWWAVSWFGKPAREVEAELQRIAAAGEPITPEELERFYTVPADRTDTTSLWMDAIREIRGSRLPQELPRVGIEGPSDLRSIPPPGEPWPQLEEAQELPANWDDARNRLPQSQTA